MVQYDCQSEVYISIEHDLIYIQQVSRKIKFILRIDHLF